MTIPPSLDQSYAAVNLPAMLDLWGSLPEVASQIDLWPQMEQLLFTETWALEEDRLSRIKKLAIAGELTSEEMKLFEQLLSLEEQNRPYLQTIMSG